MRRMRWFAALVVGAVAILIACLPRVDRARIAALETYTLISNAPEVYGPSLSVGDAVLFGPSTDIESPTSARLYLHGVRFLSSDSPTEDATIHDLARRSVVRGLREHAAK